MSPYDPGMDPRLLVRILAVCRIVVGGACVVAPDQIAPRWIGRAGRKPEARYLLRIFGVRDLVLGAGTLASMGDPASARRWILGGAASDGVDLAATVGARGDLPSSAVAGTVAAASVAIAVSLGAAAVLD
jgi:hypothetical protein